MQAKSRSSSVSPRAVRSITPEECGSVGGGFLPLIIGAAVLLGACSGANSNKVNKQSTLPTQPK